MEEGEKMKKYIKHGIFTVFVTIFLFSAINLSGIFAEYKAGEDEYSDLRAFTYEKEPTAGEDWVDDLEINFNEYKAMNDDFVGWIKINDTSINYPVVHGSNNEYYLHHTFYGKSNFAGCIFMNCENTDIDLDQNVILYGHNMKNGTMFADLRKYIEKDFWEQHKYIQLYTRTGNHIYRIYSAYTTGSSSDSYKYSFADEQSFLDFLAKTQELSDYDTGTELSANSKILTLSTCVGDASYRYVVHAVRVK